MTVVKKSRPKFPTRRPESLQFLPRPKSQKQSHIRAYMKTIVPSTIGIWPLTADSLTVWQMAMDALTICGDLKADMLRSVRPSDRRRTTLFILCPKLSHRSGWRQNWTVKTSRQLAKPSGSYTNLCQSTAKAMSSFPSDHDGGKRCYRPHRHGLETFCDDSDQIPKATAKTALRGREATWRRPKSKSDHRHATTT